MGEDVSINIFILDFAFYVYYNLLCVHNGRLRQRMHAFVIVFPTRRYDPNAIVTLPLS